MAKSQKKEGLEPIDKKVVFLKKMLFSFTLLLIISIMYIVLAEMFVNKLDESIGPTITNVPKLSKFDMRSHVININGMKSPNLDIEILIDKPSIIIIDVNGPDFYQRIKSSEYNDEYTYNLILPEDLLGKDITLNVLLHDELSRQNKYTKSYSIPEFTSPKVVVN
jgi:hypothetical protein